MPTEQPALRIRRATPLDAVNLYKLLVDEEQNTGIDVEFDEAVRLAHILHVIATGYVAVAEKSGRLVGTIGFSAGGPQYAKDRVLTSEWYFLIPSLQNSQVPARFVNRIVEFADKHNVAIRFSVAPQLSEGGALSDALQSHGFGNVQVTLSRGPANNEPADEQDATGNEPEGADGEDSVPTEPV
jgi:hypothetical protein